MSGNCTTYWYIILQPSYLHKGPIKGWRPESSAILSRGDPKSIMWSFHRNTITYLKHFFFHLTNIPPNPLKAFCCKSSSVISLPQGHFQSCQIEKTRVPYCLHQKLWIPKHCCWFGFLVHLFYLQEEHLFCQTVVGCH